MIDFQKSVRGGLLRPMRKFGLAAASRWPWPVRARIADGRVMFVDLRSVVGRAIYMKGEFDPGVFVPLRERLKPGGVFVDVGANVGFYGMLAQKIVGEDGTVHAFEIDPRPLRCLKKTLAENHVQNLRLHEIAVGDTDGVCHLVPRNDAGNSSVSVDGGGLSLAMTTLDSWRKKFPGAKVDAVKFDIEGGELAALRGAENLLRSERPLVVCEVIGELGGRTYSEPEKIFALLESFGYRWRWLAGTNDPTIVAE
jgi:FkbM family methyltransferase